MILIDKFHYLHDSKDSQLYFKTPAEAFRTTASVRESLVCKIPDIDS